MLREVLRSEKLISMWHRRLVLRGPTSVVHSAVVDDSVCSFCMTDLWMTQVEAPLSNSMQIGLVLLEPFLWRMYTVRIGQGGFVVQIFLLEDWPTGTLRIEDSK